MITKEHEVKKYCGFYASEFHVEMILLPYIKKNMYKDKFMIFTEENLSDSMNILLNRTNLNKEEKKLMQKIDWSKKGDILPEDIDNHTIIINGSKKYISKINEEINKINPKKINIIDCYGINDKNIEPNSIQEKYDEILNTKNYKNL